MSTETSDSLRSSGRLGGRMATCRRVAGERAPHRPSITGRRPYAQPRPPQERRKRKPAGGGLSTDPPASSSAELMRYLHKLVKGQSTLFSTENAALARRGSRTIRPASRSIQTTCTKEIAMTVQQQEVASVDQAQTEAFMAKAFGDFSGTMTTALCALGDRLGLFKALARGPRDAAGARRAGRHRPALRARVAAGHGSRRIPRARPRERARSLCRRSTRRRSQQEGGPMFLGGAYQEIDGHAGRVRPVAERFRSGGGVDQDQYPATSGTGCQRFTNGWFENMLVQQWIPAMPDLEAKLQAGAACADVGCGAGARVDQARRGVPGLAPRRLRCLRPRRSSGREREREGGGRRRSRALREARRRAPRAARRSTT